MYAKISAHPAFVDYFLILTELLYSLLFLLISDENIYFFFTLNNDKDSIFLTCFSNPYKFPSNMQTHRLREAFCALQKSMPTERKLKAIWEF